MTTPTFKLLVNALRLGQPPEPMAAFKVLVEVIQHQENELADLRQRLNLLTSRLQFAEAKAARIEAASLQMSGQHGSVHPEPLPAIPAMPPVPIDPRRGAPAGPAPTRQARMHMDLRSSEEIQESMQGTLNVPRADIDAVVKNQVEKEAPFPLAPPGGYARQGSPSEGSGMPFKAARPLDPSGGSLSGPAPSRPPPPMPNAGERPRSVPPPPPPARTPSVPTRSPSVPYIPIDDVDAPSDDTFSTGEVVDPIEMPALAVAKNPVPIDIISEKGPPNLSSILDESSYDDSVLTSVLRRKPGGQGS